MRQTPLPLLRDLHPNVLVVRCAFCEELVLASECCAQPSLFCPSRSIVEHSINFAAKVAGIVAVQQVLDA